MLTGEPEGDVRTGLLGPMAGASGVLVAVSGGPDSMALLDLAARWRDETPGRPPVFAGTIDHGLRAEAADEARIVAEFAALRGVPHVIIPWEGRKPATRLQERAREARYALLAAHARRVGADAIVTAHHADDQAETILMRLLRGSAVGGLAGMAPLSRREGLILFRPFLDLPKATLVAWCEAMGIPFARDPSNDDPRFGRTRARRLAALLAQEGLGAREWARLARRAARAEAALAAAAQEALRALPEEGEALPMAALLALPREIALRCLAARALAAGGAGAPRLERVEAAWTRLAQSHERSHALALTLAGACIRLDRAGRLRFSPEPARRRGRGGGGAASPQSVHANDGKEGLDTKGQADRTVSWLEVPLATGPVAPRL